MNKVIFKCNFLTWDFVLQQYVKGISKTGMQSNHGFEGQINACWTHKMTWEEIEQIRSAGFLISVIHGRYAHNYYKIVLPFLFVGCLLASICLVVNILVIYSSLFPFQKKKFTVS